MELKKFVTPAIVGVGSFTVGAVGGYFFRRYRETHNLEAEIKDTRDGVISDMEALESQFTQLVFAFEERDQKYDSHLQQAMKVIAALQDAKREFMLGTVEALQPLQHNEEEHVFAVVREGERWSEDDDDWNYEEELETRSPDKPYVIHRDEYFANEMQLTQSTLTYYKGDNVLCDDLDVPVYQPEKVVGPLKFGHGSQDPSIVYIRNEELEGEYEVLLEYGTFESEILNQKVSKDLGVGEFKHSLMKFREE